jgi:hypothetical protein
LLRGRMTDFYLVSSGIQSSNLSVHTPFLFPESYLFLPVRCNDRDSISGESNDSVKQSMLQSLISLWKEILVLSSSTLLSRDRTLASNILGSGGCCARLGLEVNYEYLFSASGIL